MKKFKHLILLLLTMLITTTLFAGEIANSPNLISGKLPNGVHYYIFKNKKPEERATLNLVVKTGSLLETDKEQGIAHFLEHMAFNGTTKYKKNDMIKYLQSIGLDFGGDLNAYTTFDRTVYKLNVPTTPKELNTGIEVLREWASEVTLTPEEVENEKNIVIEEWRLSQGLSQRLGDVHKKALFEGSRYYDRFPIGLPEIIKGADRNLLKGFYDKWYQPQNISVVAVGDFDTKVVEDAIKKYFNYKAPKKQNLPVEYDLAKLQNKYVTFSDPELRFNTFYITKILDGGVLNNTENFKKSVIDSIIINALNSRIYNLTLEKNTPLVEGFFNKYAMTRDKDVFNGIVVIKNDVLESGIKLLNNFFKSSAINGLTQNELDLEKHDLYSSIENQVANKDSIKHRDYAENLVDHIMYNEAFTEIEAEFELYKQVLNEITLEDVNKELRAIYDEQSLYLLTTSSKQATINEKQLEKIVAKAQKDKNLKDYSIKPVELNPMELTSGKIVATQDNKEYTTFTLSNGIKAYTKNTDFDKDRIIITLFKKEGSSVEDYKGFINSLIVSEIIEDSAPNNLQPQDIESFMKGKNFSINTYIGDYEQGLNITSDKKNIKQALEYMSQLVFLPKIDSEVFENGIEELRENVESRKNSPKAVYRDEIKKIYSGNNERRNPLSLEDIELLNQEEVMKIYKDKFNNFNGYQMIVVGSLDGIDVKGLLEKYFASLPVTKESKKPQPLKLNTPQNIVEKNVVKGIDKKATTTLIFPCNIDYGYEEKTLYRGFADLLNIALIEDIREKIGGVYSIWAYTTLSPNNYGENKLVISYSCDTNRVDEIKKAVLVSVDKMLNKEIDQNQINSVVKNYELSYKTKIKQNNFWVNYIYQKNTIKGYKLATPEEFKAMMTKKNIWKVNRKAVNLKNYIDVTLIPEKDSL